MVGTLLMVCTTITVTRNPAARMNGRSQIFRGPWFLGGATDRLFVGMVVVAAENSAARRTN